MLLTLIHNQKQLTIDKKKFKVVNKKSKKYYISFLPNELIIKQYAINKNIKEKYIYQILYSKISKEIEEEFTFNYYFLNSEEDTNIYEVEIIKKKDLENKIKSIKKDYIEFITTDYHSLFHISKKYFNEFISIYIDSSYIVYIYGKEKLTHFRYIDINNLDIENIAQDIKRTIIYFKQQSKNIELSNILISGNLEIINQIYDKIDEPLSLPLNLSIKNISKENFLKNFLLFGLLFANENFLPQEIKKLKIFNYTFIGLLATSIIVLLYFGFKLYSIYSYNSLLENILESKKIKFLKEKKETKVYSLNEVNYIISYLKAKNESYNSKTFLNKISKLSNIFNILNIDSISVDNDIKIYLSKQYKSFRKLIYDKENLEKFLKNYKYHLQINYKNNSILLVILLKRENV